MFVNDRYKFIVNFEILNRNGSINKGRDSDTYRLFSRPKHRELFEHMSLVVFIRSDLKYILLVEITLVLAHPRNQCMPGRKQLSTNVCAFESLKTLILIHPFLRHGP